MRVSFILENHFFVFLHEPMLPRKFQFEMGGFHSGRYSLVWDGTQLVYDARGRAFGEVKCASL